MFSSALTLHAEPPKASACVILSVFPFFSQSIGVYESLGIETIFILARSGLTLISIIESERDPFRGCHGRASLPSITILKGFRNHKTTKAKMIEIINFFICFLLYNLDYLKIPKLFFLTPINFRYFR